MAASTRPGAPRFSMRQSADDDGGAQATFRKKPITKLSPYDPRQRYGRKGNKPRPPTGSAGRNTFSCVNQIVQAMRTWLGLKPRAKRSSREKARTRRWRCPHAADAIGVKPLSQAPPVEKRTRGGRTQSVPRLAPLPWQNSRSTMSRVGPGCRPGSPAATRWLQWDTMPCHRRCRYVHRPGTAPTVTAIGEQIRLPAFTRRMKNRLLRLVLHLRMSRPVRRAATDPTIWPGRTCIRPTVM